MVQIATVRSVIHDIVLALTFFAAAAHHVSIGKAPPVQAPPVQAPPVQAPPVQAPPVQAPAPPVLQPVRPVQPVPTHNPAEATAVLTAAGSQGSATVVDEPAGPGYYYAVTAGHCVPEGVNAGQLKFRGGHIYRFSVVRRDGTSDVALIVFAGPAGMPTAQLAAQEPSPRTKVWHKGWGEHKPGNKETGQVLAGPDANGKMDMRLSVSPGDSGAGIFRVDNGQLVAVVSSRRPGHCYGGSVNALRRLLADQASPNCPDGRCPPR